MDLIENFVLQIIIIIIRHMKECIVGISKTPFYDNNETIKQNTAVNIKNF
jgi:hypothetical protein